MGIVEELMFDGFVVIYVMGWLGVFEIEDDFVLLIEKNWVCFRDSMLWKVDMVCVVLYCLVEVVKIEGKI